MESENVQDEDLTSHVIETDFIVSKDLHDQDDSPLKSDHVDAKKPKVSMPGVLLDPNESGSQLERVNGKVSEKEDEEESLDPEQLSQSSSSDDSSASSDVSSSSSDDERSKSFLNQSNTSVNSDSPVNQWSSSLTGTGIKLSVKSIRDCNQPGDSNKVEPSKVFCDDVKSSRLSDDSSSSDSVETPSKLENCKDWSSPEKDDESVNSSPNPRRSSTNFKGSISNFNTSIDSIPIENSNSGLSNYNANRNERQSIDSVGSHVSLKSNEIVFERKLSLSSDSSDSENSRDQPEPVQNVSQIIENTLCNSVKSNLNNSFIKRIDPHLNHENSNELLNSSTCVKFNDVITARSPEKTLTSPLKEASQDSCLSDKFFNSTEKTDNSSLNNSFNSVQKVNSSQAPVNQLSNNVDQSPKNSSNQLMLNSVSKTKNISKPENSVEEMEQEDSNNSDHTQPLKDSFSNCTGGERNLKDTIAVRSVRNSSEVDAFGNRIADEDSCSNSNSKEICQSISIGVKTSNANISKEVTKTNKPSKDLDLNFESQDMGMEISSDSSLSDDEGSEVNMSHLNNLSSGNEDSDQENEELAVDVMAVIGGSNEKESLGAGVDVMDVIGCKIEEESGSTASNDSKTVGLDSKEEPYKTTTDIMNVIGCSKDIESEGTSVDVMKVIGSAMENDSEGSPTDVIHPNIGGTSKKELDAVMRIIGVSNETEPMDIDVLKVIGGSDFVLSKNEDTPSMSNKEDTRMSLDQSFSDSCSEPKDGGETSTTVKNKESGLSSPDVEMYSNSLENKLESEESTKRSDLGTYKEETNVENSKDSDMPTVTENFGTDSETQSSSLTKRLSQNDCLESCSLKKKKLLPSSKHKYILPAPSPGQNCGEIGEEHMTEYAQYLGLQPSLKFKCCICAQVGFQSYAELREHQKNCQSSEACRSSTSLEKPNFEKVTYPTADDINQMNFRISRKVYLCSACGTYYENWELFLHMQEVHHQFICLLCLKMFKMSYLLSDHLVLIHGVEVKSFPTLSDFKEMFNCALFVSCTDCGKTFGESDDWSSHNCSFVCNVCNVKNGHLPRCQRNLIFKGNQTDTKVATTKCIIRVNPSTTTTMILPKRDDKSYDIASSFCSVDLQEGESMSGAEPSDSEKFESPKCSDLPQVVKPNDTPILSRLFGEGNSKEETIIPTVNSPVQPSEESNLAACSKDSSGSHGKVSNLPEEEDLGTKNNEDESRSSTLTALHDHSPNPSGNQGDATFSNSNAEEMDNLVETSNSILENKSDTQVKKFNEVSSVDSRESQKSENPVKCSDMKLIIKKSAFNNPNFRLNSNFEKVESQADPDNDSLDEEDEEGEEGESKLNKSDSSVFDPDYEAETKPARSRSITSPINCEDENESPEPTGSNHHFQTEENVDSKSILNPTDQSQISEKDSEKNDSNIDVSMESQPSVSDDSRMQYESDSQPADASSNIASNLADTNPKQNPSVNSNDTSDSDSNKLSMAVDNNDMTTDSKSSLKSNHADEKMIIDYDGDNAVDNFDSDQGSPSRSGPDDDGIELASKEVPALTLPLSSPLESVPLNTLVKECVRIACTACSYCNHALKIAVHARELVLHLLAEHRFTPSRVEDSPEKLISVLKNGLTPLENIFFNTNSYDSSDKASNLPYDGTFSCFQCPFWTLQHKDLYTHKRKMHQKTILLCVMCKSNFYSYSELLCHMCPGTYQPNDILFRCCFCNIDKIPSAFRLMVHIRKSHHTCEICLDVSTDQQKLATHMWKHKLHHLCYRCGIAYRNKPDITRHLFWKHGTESVLCKKCLQKKWPHVYHFCIPPATVVCDECNATFTRTVALRVHKRLHSNEKPHACTQCEEKFISKKILEKHEISHSSKEEGGSGTEVEKKEYDPAVAESLGLTNPPIQIQKTDEKQNIDVDDDTVPVVRIKKNKTKKKKPMLDLTDLPPLNLSSESDSEPELPKSTMPLETVEVKSEIEGKPEEPSDMKENILAETEEKKESNVEETEEKKEPNVEETEERKEPNAEETEDKKESNAEETASKWLDVIMADHDYCKPKSSEPEGSENKEIKPETSIDMNASLNSTLDTKETSASDSSPTKRKSKSPKKKLNKSSNSSSSSSSSDTDSSSCSCGPNCSCSSSSSDSSTSTSSDSDSSSPENRRKQEERRQKRRERGKTKSPKIDTQAEPAISVENEEPYIMESDLDTDITLTDEDFYDEYPQQHANKMLAEKQQSEKDQLMLLASVAPTHTAPSSPMVSAEEAPATPQPVASPKLKKKLKTKRKRNEALLPTSMPPDAPTLESKLSQLPATPPLITKLPNPNARNYSVPQTPTSEHFSDRTLSTGGSGSESESKRSSKRRRVKNKFYGYSSEEENQTENSKPRFRPKKHKKVVAMRKSEPTLTRPNPFNVSFPIQPPSMSSYQPYQSHQPTITIKPVLPPVSNVVRSTLPPVRHRPPTPSSSSDSDDDKLNIDEKFPEPPQAQASFPPMPPATQPSGEKNSNLYCYCQCPYDEVSEMIACDGNDCRIEWFHFECVGIMVPPKGQWFCPDCRKKKNLSY
nr:PREDICTED: uncharacterized protein LOC109032581 [Bemisia tabaci]